MEKSRSQVTGILTSAALAAAVTLAVGWPSHVNAVGNDEQATEQQAALAVRADAPENSELGQNEYKVGDLEVTATLQPSEANAERQVIRLECNNPTQGRIEGVIQVALTRTSGSGGERVMPTPKIAWRHHENVAVEPGATLIREVTMPKIVSAEVARIAKLQKAAEQSETARYPNVYFGATAEAIDSSMRVAKGKGPKRPNPGAVDAPTEVANSAPSVAEPRATPPADTSRANVTDVGAAVDSNGATGTSPSAAAVMPKPTPRGAAPAAASSPLSTRLRRKVSQSALSSPKLAAALPREFGY
jgi:hypothetical protein